MAKRRMFDELKVALDDALRYERGAPVDLRTTAIAAPTRRISPRQIKDIRLGLHASHATFAKLLNVSPNTIESWEQGVRHPRQAALKLLAIARKYPRVLLEA